MPAAKGLGDLGDEGAAAAESEDEMQGRAAFEGIVCCCLVVGPVGVTNAIRHGFEERAGGGNRGEGGRGREGDEHLLAAVDEALLDRWDAFFLFDLLFDL